MQEHGRRIQILLGYDGGSAEIGGQDITVFLFDPDPLEIAGRQHQQAIADGCSRKAAGHPAGIPALSGHAACQIGALRRICGGENGEGSAELLAPSHRKAPGVKKSGRGHRQGHASARLVGPACQKPG